eukprot:TRINITY_DN29515_c0_g3_i1.p1 TRINITY_DN29515_c0_g3~~TRINITY_DN29515_c0_g3_i1.p1  ORF type:complete len:141 (-),score=28.62 TRINITY_DN29515_c0_g3_i1:107-529(-)
MLRLGALPLTRLPPRLLHRQATPFRAVEHAAASFSSSSSSKAVVGTSESAASKYDVSALPVPTSPRVKYKKKKFCPECGKRVVADQVEDMRTACDRMWRKYMQLHDLHCPLYLACRVQTNEGYEEVPETWQPMPRLKGRS